MGVGPHTVQVKRTQWVKAQMPELRQYLERPQKEKLGAGVQGSMGAAHVSLELAGPWAYTQSNSSSGSRDCSGSSGSSPGSQAQGFWTPISCPACLSSPSSL